MKTKVWGGIFLAIGLILIFVGFTYPRLGVMSVIIEKPLITPTLDNDGANQFTQITPDSIPSNKQACPDTLQQSELKGCLFEEWVKQRFDKRLFSTETWNKSGSLDNALTGSAIPDFYYKIQTETKKAHFHIECVYRSSPFNGEISWGSEEKVSGLNAYAMNIDDPVFLILGLGGTPDMPHEIWVIKITGNTPGKYLLVELPKARRVPDADFKFDPITETLF